MSTVALVVQITITALWAATISLHTRRLLRLAHVAVSGTRTELRQQLRRVWWWLGRKEYWSALENDLRYCLQLTILLLLLAWGLR
jgi:hypothetical protein